MEPHEHLSQILNIVQDSLKSEPIQFKKFKVECTWTEFVEAANEASAIETAIAQQYDLADSNYKVTEVL